MFRLGRLCSLILISSYLLTACGEQHTSLEPEGEPITRSVLPANYFKTGFPVTAHLFQQVNKPAGQPDGQYFSWSIRDKDFNIDETKTKIIKLRRDPEPNGVQTCFDIVQPRDDSSGYYCVLMQSATDNTVYGYIKFSYNADNKTPTEENLYENLTDPVFGGFLRLITDDMAFDKDSFQRAQEEFYERTFAGVVEIYTPGERDSKNPSKEVNEGHKVLQYQIAEYTERKTDFAKYTMPSAHNALAFDPSLQAKTNRLVDDFLTPQYATWVEEFNNLNNLGTLEDKARAAWDLQNRYNKLKTIGQVVVHNAGQINVNIPAVISFLASDRTDDNIANALQYCIKDPETKLANGEEALAEFKKLLPEDDNWEAMLNDEVIAELEKWVNIYSGACTN